jgi:predicted ArsR family transcriptional regulator
MRSAGWDKHFLQSTRGRIILLLRAGSRTVNDLAAALGLTDNAVRTHLTALERDGLVRPSGTRPGTRRPTITYARTPEAGRLFPKVYGPLLRHLLDELAERLPAKKLDDTARAVGHRLAEECRAAVRADTLSDRVTQAVALLGEWGGFCTPERQDGKVILRCPDCPLALVVAGKRVQRPRSDQEAEDHCGSGSVNLRPGSPLPRVMGQLSRRGDRSQLAGQLHQTIFANS